MINQPSNLSHKPMTIPLAHQPIIVTLSHQPITITLSLIYHHQTTITRSSHMDTKIITKPCTSTISHVHQPCTIPCINHVHQPVPYHVSTMHRPCTKTYTIPRTSTMYHTMHQPCTSTCTIPCINHASTMYQNLYHPTYINLYHTMYINHVSNMYRLMHQPCTIPSK